jgi:hypothetical protein
MHLNSDLDNRNNILDKSFEDLSYSQQGKSLWKCLKECFFKYVLQKDTGKDEGYILLLVISEKLFVRKHNSIVINSLKTIVDSRS